MTGIRTGWLCAVAAGTIVFALGCGGDTQEQSGISTQLSDVASKAKTEFGGQIASQVEGFEEKLGDFKEQIDALPEAARGPARQKLGELETALADLKKKVGGLDKVDPGSWGDMKSELESSVKKMDSGFEDLSKLLPGN